MADAKISGLPASTTPLDGTEVLPIVQASVTKQVSIANITAGRATSALSFIPSGATIPTNGMYLPAANKIGFATNSINQVNIDATGNLLIGLTVPGFSSTSQIFSPYGMYCGNATSSGYSNSTSANIEGGSGRFIANHASGASSGSLYMGFAYAGGSIGSITQNGTTGVLYNLTSDYRLKKNVTPLKGAKAFVMALQPKTWDWWDDSSKGVGFIAHEFMQVAKFSGNGKKDEIDEEGKPVYQSIQPSSSEVMANLVALIQEIGRAHV